ncbi:MAG: oxidoreductase [Candidatus Tectomicrobia bacterium]|uniref:Oxidoreductase n=1 Tax=Tectimicrobiota bacterium TaxID=2528274 RepID=A0A933LQL7_UNCTE|nr:oxidoreductase [Candidatus Tectomicrobia bacterium]
MSKLKAAFYWCASCGGCEEAIVDVNEDLLKVIEALDIVFWPVALDVKVPDLEKIDDIGVSFINGAVRNDDQEHVVKLLRKKSRLLVAFGTCACFGGVAGGLGNLSSKEVMLSRVFIGTPSTQNPEAILPAAETVIEGGKLTLPDLYDSARAINQVVEVDYYLPGCSVPREIVMHAINSILEGKLPAKGTYLIPSQANLCEVCERKETLPGKMQLDLEEMKRPHEMIIDTEKCFLAQGLICMGMATNAGCGWDKTGRCIRVNIPCRGCFGPTEKNPDQGIATLSALSSMFSTTDTERINRLVDSIVDPEGTMYRYTLISSKEGL